MTKWLTIDNGLYLELARGLGGKYYTPYNASFFPRYEDYAVGMGFVDKVKYFFDEVDKCDAIANFDVHENDLIAFLRKHFPQKPIMGSGHAEKLENDRWQLKKVIEKLGLPLQKSVRLKGVHALCDYIQKNPDKYVKVDIFRGTINSFYAKDYKSVELLMEDWEDALGVYSEDFEFVVEDAIHTAQEWGVDSFFSGGEYSDYSFFGIELNKDNYIGKCVKTSELPKPLLETLTKFKPVFKDLDYRSPISTEEKIVSPEKHYFLDLCARAPNPLGLIYPEAISNWSDMCFDIASNKPPKMKSKYKYVGCVPLYSKWVKNNWVKVNYDKKYENNVKFMTACRKDGHTYAVKGSPEELICVVVAGDSTIDGLIKKLKEVVDNVDAYMIDRNAVGELDKINEIIKNASKIGISF